ncbi:MAG: signal recognition particle-docking protein FtsY [Rickettsiales bacterium]
MSWFKKLSDGLRKTTDSIGSVFVKRKLDQPTLDELEETLILADMGAATASAIIAELAIGRVDKDIEEREIKHLLAAAITKRLEPYAKALDTEIASPTIILVVGVNGNGKTTTIGKLAYSLTKQGKRVTVIAADTFRAAAVEQLQRWSERANCSIVRGADNADPAAVAYAGLEQALREKADLVFIDTAGRLHTKENLMAELAKITKVIKKLLPEAPHAVLQVLDATTGQNALAQVKAFREAAGVTGLVVTKLDGTAKAGIVVALAEQFKLPIYAIGVGEGAEDLQPFSANDFALALVGL